MTLKEMKQKVLKLIEEYSGTAAGMTGDPDISAKLNDVINQIMFELARIKKIPKYIELDVTEGELVDFSALEAAVGYEIYQINLVGGVRFAPRANGTVLKFLESGKAEIDVYVYPERITSATKDSYEFELTPDVLELMPFGVAADLLKSDVSADYGSVYANRYESMLQRLDTRNAIFSAYIEGGLGL